MARGMLALSLLLFPLLTTAYPYYWTDPQGTAISSRTAPACTVHPDNTQHGGHSGTQADAGTAISLTTAAGVAAGTTVCPGEAYTIRVSWGSGTRRYMVSSTFGSFASATTPNTAVYYYSRGANAPSCPNRLVSSGTGSAFSDVLTLPCGITGSMVVQFSSAGSSGSSIRQASATFTVNPACGVGACAVVAPSPAPVVAPSPAATPTPVPVVSPAPVPVVVPSPAVVAPVPSPKAAPVPTTPVPAPVPSPAATPAPTPVVAPSPAASVPAPVDTTARGATCPPSSLGYACSIVQGPVTIHYSLGGAIPTNPCTGSNGGTTPGDSANGAGFVHMAVQANTQGYVGLAFAKLPNRMPDSDIVVGWLQANGQGVVDSYYATREDLGPGDAKAWATNKGVARVGNQLTVCFTRALAQPLALASANLDPVQGWNLNWAVASEPGYSGHEVEGSTVLNVATGATEQIVSRKNKHIRIHGALMATAYALLFPLGALFPCHRWVLGNMKVAGLHIWFRVHVLIQLAGVAIATAGFAWSWIYLDNPGRNGSKIGDTHRILGIIVYALTCLQMVAGFLRPPLDSKYRSAFTHGHRWAGRVTIYASWAVVYLGIYLYHTGVFRASLLQWVLPVAISMGVMILADLALTIAALAVGNKPGQEAQDGSAKEHGFADLETVQMGEPYRTSKSGAAAPNGEHRRNSRDYVP